MFRLALRLVPHSLPLLRLRTLTPTPSSLLRLPPLPTPHLARSVHVPKSPRRTTEEREHRLGRQATKRRQKAASWHRVEVRREERIRKREARATAETGDGWGVKEPGELWEAWRPIDLEAERKKRKKGRK